MMKLAQLQNEQVALRTKGNTSAVTIRSFEMKYGVPLHVVLPLWRTIVTSTSNMSPGLSFQPTTLRPFDEIVDGK